MGKPTDNFFDTKKEWSIAKDDLLRCYLRPYMAKLFHSGRMNVYIDCFAGAGKFGDNPIEYVDINDDSVPVHFGSPLIALKEILRSMGKSTALNPRYFACFIEKEYAQSLDTNLNESQFSDSRYAVIEGSYQHMIHEVMKVITDRYRSPNLLCYLDPYGVKVLKLEYLQQFMQYKLNSIEFLINFNSFGFFRYACAAFNIVVREQDIQETEDIIEMDPLTKTEVENNRLKIFNEIIGTPAWKRAIQSYQKGFINGFQAERIISGLYQRQLKKLGFEYVLNIPIRLNSSVHPKYRMVYATKHEDGAVLMGDIMHQREHYLYDVSSIKRGGGYSLFDIEDMNQERPIDECIIELLELEGELGGTVFYAKFYTRYYLTSRIGEALKTLEKEARISIRRTPEITKKGKISTFTKERNNHRMFIKLNK